MMIEVAEGGTFTVMHNKERIDVRVESILAAGAIQPSAAKVWPAMVRLNIVDIPRGSTVEIVAK